MQSKWDKFGVLNAGLCVIHCVGMLLVAWFAPTVLSVFGTDVVFHGIAVSLGIIIAWSSFSVSKVDWLLILGIVMLVSDFWLESKFHWVTILGNAVVFYRHFKRIHINSHKCNHC